MRTAFEKGEAVEFNGADNFIIYLKKFLRKMSVLEYTISRHEKKDDFFEVSVEQMGGKIF